MPARPGRPRKPTALRVIEGNRGKRPLPKNEPKPAPKMPTCPPGLSLAAQAVWKRLAPELHERGLLTDWDRDAFAVYCQAVAEHGRARALLSRDGLTVKGRHDDQVTNPAWRIFRDSAAMIRAFAGEFGLTPSARAGIELPEGGEDDPSIFNPVRVRSRG